MVYLMTNIFIAGVYEDPKGKGRVVRLSSRGVNPVGKSDRQNPIPQWKPATGDRRVTDLGRNGAKHNGNRLECSPGVARRPHGKASGLSAELGAQELHAEDRGAEGRGAAVAAGCASAHHEGE